MPIKTRVDESQVFDVNITPELFEEFKKDFQKAVEKSAAEAPESFFDKTQTITTTLHKNIKKDPKGSVRMYFISEPDTIRTTGDIDVPGYTELDTKRKNLTNEELRAILNGTSKPKEVKA